MGDVLYLAWRYLAYHRLKTVVLVASVAAIVFLPLGLNILMTQGGEQLERRASETPLLVGSKGSPLELVLRSLYFESDQPESFPQAEGARVEQSGLARAIPLYTRFETRHGPIVGTTQEYFGFRKLEIAAGRLPEMMGECVIGSEVASAGDLEPGDSVISSPENVFDLTGAQPLKMNIVGVLKRSGSADDRAVFVDLKTTWIIEGLGHGHVKPVDDKQGAAHATVERYNEITSENVGSFHFHGDMSTFSITSVIVLPNDEKAATLLQGRYLGGGERVQMVVPVEVMRELLGTIFTVGRYVTAAMVVVACSTLATMALVFLLSWQLRRRELETMVKIGCSRRRIVAIVGVEVLGVLCLGVLLAIVLAVATSWFAPAVMRALVQLS